MPLLPLMTGLILFFSGIVIGYLFSFRDRSDNEALNESLCLERDRLANELSAQRTESVDLGERLNKQTGKLQLLEELCGDLDNCKKSNEQQIIDLQSELTSMRNSLDESKSSLNEEQNKRTALEDRLHEMKQGHVESLNSIQIDWREKLGLKDSMVSQLDSEVVMLKSTCTRTSEKLQMSEARVAELQAELEKQKVYLETASNNASGLEREYITLENSLTSQNEILKEARGKAAAALSAKELAEESLKDMRIQLASHQSLVNDFNESRHKLEAMQHRCEALQESIENSKERLNQITMERDTAISAEKQALEAVGGLRKRTENQESTIRDLREKSEQMATTVQLEMNARTELEETLNQKQRQFEIRLNSYEGIEGRIDELKDALAAKEAEVDALESRREEQLAAMQSELKDALAAKEAEVDALETRREEQLAAMQSELKDALAVKEAEVEALESRREEQLAAMKSELSVELEEQNQEFLLRIQHLVEQRDKAMVECNELRDELDRAQLMSRQNEVTIRNLRRERGAVLMRNRQTTQITQTDFPRIHQSEEETYSSHDDYGGQTRLDPVRGVVFTEAPDTSDDLKKISGIAEILEKRLNDFGIFTYKQIIEWDRKAVDEFSALLAFRDRIDRDDWKGQAQVLYNQKYVERRAA